jgi:hypothetical protein
MNAAVTKWMTVVRYTANLPEACTNRFSPNLAYSLT